MKQPYYEGTVRPQFINGAIRWFGRATYGNQTIFTSPGDPTYQDTRNLVLAAHGHVSAEGAWDAIEAACANHAEFTNEHDAEADTRRFEINWEASDSDGYVVDQVGE